MRYTPIWGGGGTAHTGRWSIVKLAYPDMPGREDFIDILEINKMLQAGHKESDFMLFNKEKVGEVSIEVRGKFIFKVVEYC